MKAFHGELLEMIDNSYYAVRERVRDMIGGMQGTIVELTATYHTCHGQSIH